MSAARESCGYQGYEFGAGTYPDSVCIDGFLHDADHCDNDGNIYLNDEAIPCPMCDREAAIQWWFERNALSWEDSEDEDDDEGHNRRALEAATSLVDDIRRNRGVEPPTQEPTP